MPTIDPQAPESRRPMERADEPRVPKLRLTVEDADGNVTYSTWQDGRETWSNAFIVFGSTLPAIDGTEIGTSLWDVPNPVEQRGRILDLEAMLRTVADDVGVAVWKIGEAHGEDAATLAREVLAHGA